MPFPILIGTTLTTVLHYRADCEMFIVRLQFIVKFSRRYTDSLISAACRMLRFYRVIRYEAALYS